MTSALGPLSISTTVAESHDTDPRSASDTAVALTSLPVVGGGDIELATELASLVTGGVVSVALTQLHGTVAMDIGPSVTPPASEDA